MRASARLLVSTAIATLAGCASRSSHTASPSSLVSRTADASLAIERATADSSVRAADGRCERDLECHFFVSRTCEMTAVHGSLVSRAPYAGQECRELGMGRCMCAIPAFRPRCVNHRCELDRSFSWVAPANTTVDGGP